jgi:anti-sigma-K factor RskA
LSRHCDDDALLGYLDGELASGKRRRVEKHLQRCWDCRARAGELERQIESLVKSLRHANFPPADVIEAGRRKVLARIQAAESSAALFSQTDLVRHNRGLWRFQAASIAASACAVLAAVSFWAHSRDSHVAAAQVLAEARERELTFYRRAPAIQQTFRVDEVEISPQRRQRSGRLTVWTKGADRFALRWEDQAGVLQHGVWKPASDHRYLYDRRLGANPIPNAPQTMKVASLAQLARYGLSLEELEEGFGKWLDSQNWRPISLGEDFSEFAGQAGVSLVTKRIKMQTGAPGLRIVARRNDARISIELRMDMDSASLRPIVETVRFETPGRAVEFRLSMDRLEEVPSASLKPAVFEPDAPEWQPMQRAAGRPIVRSVASPPPRRLAPIQELAVRALYSLHRSKACLDDEIAVDESPSSGLRIHGVVQDEARKNEIVDAMVAAAIPKEFIHIQTFDEASSAVPSSDATASIAISHDRTKLPVEELLAQLALRADLRTQAEEIRRHLPELSNDAITFSGSVLSEAWALQHLAQRFRPDRVRSLTPSSRELLETMVRDHEQNFLAQASKVKDRFEPVLSLLILQDGTGGPGLVEREHAGTDWADACSEAFEGAKRLDQRLHWLFAGSDLSGVEPAKTAFEVLAELRTFSVRAKHFDEVVSGSFLDPPDARRAGVEHQETISPIR